MACQRKPLWVNELRNQIHSPLRVRSLMSCVWKTGLPVAIVSVNAATWPARIPKMGTKRVWLSARRHARVRAAELPPPTHVCRAPRGHQGAP
jgi:hypothetical protein